LGGALCPVMPRSIRKIARGERRLLRLAGPCGRWTGPPSAGSIQDTARPARPQMPSRIPCDSLRWRLNAADAARPLGTSTARAPGRVYYLRVIPRLRNPCGLLLVLPVKNTIRRVALRDLTCRAIQRVHHANTASARCAAGSFVWLSLFGVNCASPLGRQSAAIGSR